MSEFSGFDFAAGAVRGLRAFRVDQLGRLTGYMYIDPWRPGENVAKCGGASGQRRDWSTITASLLAAGTYGGFAIPTSTSTTRPSPLSKDGEVTEHDMAKCQCGFYAYFDGSNDYANKGTVAAVVEGYGKTVLGTRGFRSDKARIVALALPVSKPAPLNVRFGRKVPESWRPLAGGLCPGLIATLLMFAASMQAAWLWAVALAAAPLAVWVMRGIWRADFDGFERDSRASVPKHLLDKVRRNYPDVPVFDSVKAMVRAFPPDKGVEPSPETDPQFWTRTVTR